MEFNKENLCNFIAAASTFIKQNNSKADMAEFLLGIDRTCDELRAYFDISFDETDFESTEGFLEV